MAWLRMVSRNILTILQMYLDTEMVVSSPVIRHRGFDLDHREVKTDI